MAPFVPLDEMIEGSDSLHMEVAKHLAHVEIQANARADIASTLATLVVEHSHAILLLVIEGKTSSALALVRVQYEALVRAFWLYFAAPETVVHKCVEPLAPHVTNEPDLFPTITDMLAKVEGKAPAPVVRALVEFKAAAWGAMNSFTHGNLRTMMGHRNGYHPGLLSQTIQNTNGAAMFATLLLAQVTNSNALGLAVLAISRTHARFLPPLKLPTPK